MSVFQFLKIYNHREELGKCLNEIVYAEDFAYEQSERFDAKYKSSVDLQSGIFVEVKSPHKCINIRRSFVPHEGTDGELHPGFGVSLNTYEWHHLWHHHANGGVDPSPRCIRQWKLLGA